MDHKFVIVDLETTGNSPNKGDKIIQFAAAVVRNGKIIEKFSSLINPGRDIPLFIVELTGITNEMVKDAPFFSEIAPKILDLLGDSYFVAHNALFDLSFLQSELIQSGYEGFFGSVLDTVEMARVLFPTADSYQLNELAKMQGLVHERPHQADSDALVTAQLFIRLLEKFYRLPLVTIRQLYKLSGGLKSDIALLLDDLIFEREARVENLPETVEIFNGIVLRKKQNKDKSIFSFDAVYPEEEEDKEHLFRQAFPFFEKRKGQFEMMDFVFQAFSEKRHTLIEAGTGVGKSLGYLLPSAYFAKLHNEKVIISTYTNQLQEQLLFKEVQLLEKMLPFSVKVSLMKGKNHYLSLRRFVQSLRETDNNYDVALTKMQILVWLTETETGDLDELNLSSGGLLFWEKVNHDRTDFLGKELWETHDFYFQAKQEAQEADLVITNHSLLLAEIVQEKSVLPEYEYCVIDEGHHFAEAARKCFSHSLDYLSVRMVLNKFGYYTQKKLLYELDRLLQVKNLHLGLFRWNSIEAEHLFSELIFEMDALFKAVSIYALKKIGRTTYHKISCRVVLEENSREWQAVIASGERFSFLLKDLADYISEPLKILNESQQNLTEKQKNLLGEFEHFQLEINSLREKIRSMLLQPSPSEVCWIELDVRSVQNNTTVYSLTLLTSSIFKEKFFQRKKSVVITSASLTVNNSFQFVQEELGLGGYDCRFHQIHSPFHYQDQVQLIIPEDLPEISSVPLEEYVTAITGHIISIAEAAKGRMMILFTSFEMLKKTYELLNESGFLKDYIIIAQGISSGSRTRLTRNFQRFEKAILLGTNSFWEGIDIPGEDLSCLVMVRLPFSPPNEPVTEAKCEIIKKKGKNPFMEWSLPEAILRFKQGFGRLIRTSKDKGFIVVFDKRIHTTKYGKVFLQSIPPIPVKYLTIKEMVNLIESKLQ